MPVPQSPPWPRGAAQRGDRRRRRHDWALVDRLSVPTYSADTTAAMTTALARAGVATFADPSSQHPRCPCPGAASPFQLLDFQTHALAVGAWAGTTWSGAELDQVLPIPDGMTGVAPTSDVLAGYVAAVDTPGAQLARALMAGQNLLDPATVEFPGVVLVLFASDIATRLGQRRGTNVEPEPCRAHRPASAGPRPDRTRSRYRWASLHAQPVRARLRPRSSRARSTACSMRSRSRPRTTSCWPSWPPSGTGSWTSSRSSSRTSSPRSRA